MEHFYFFIEGWFDYQDIYKDIADKYPNGSNFAIVGVWKGRCTAFMAVELLNLNKPETKIHCIDNFCGGTYDAFTTNIEPVKSQIIISDNMPSVEKAATYPDSFFEFVFIDAAHDYESVKADISAWLPKVKKGGVLAGHDYVTRYMTEDGQEAGFPGVVQAVNESFAYGEYEKNNRSDYPGVRQAVNEKFWDFGIVGSSWVVQL